MQSIKETKTNKQFDLMIVFRTLKICIQKNNV